MEGDGEGSTGRLTFIDISNRKKKNSDSGNFSQKDVRRFPLLM